MHDGRVPRRWRRALALAVERAEQDAAVTDARPRGAAPRSRGPTRCVPAPTLAEVARLLDQPASELARLVPTARPTARGGDRGSSRSAWCGVATDEGGPHSETCGELAERSPAAAELWPGSRRSRNSAPTIVAEMDFRFLFDRTAKLFAIGYQQASHSLDASYYDLLASEARLASFIAIAKNDVPVDHWFRLGRTLTHAAGATRRWCRGAGACSST